MATSTATRAKAEGARSGTKAATRAKAGGGAKAAGKSIDARMRFNWLDTHRANVVYEGEECVISLPGRARGFRGATLAAAVNQGIEMVPLRK